MKTSLKNTLYFFFFFLKKKIQNDNFDQIVCNLQENKTQ